MSELRIEIDRLDFQMKVYRWKKDVHRYRRLRTYKIATGAINYATPVGPYRVAGKTRTPAWAPPSFSELHGEIIPFDDPRNPFEGGFIAFAGHPSTRGDGVGIHGTRFDPQIGTRASHGCIRMTTPDFLDLYDLVEVGTEVTVYGDYR